MIKLRRPCLSQSTNQFKNHLVNSYKKEYCDYNWICNKFCLFLNAGNTSQVSDLILTGLFIYFLTFFKIVVLRIHYRFTKVFTILLRDQKRKQNVK
jgi:hypothetical protein